MADQKGGSFSKGIAKRFVRTKEKVLQNLGKADKTTDDVFDEHVANFTKQQASAQKLQKELKNYLVCVKAMSEASKNLFNTIQDTYEPEWVQHNEVRKHIESLELIWNDYQERLTDSIQNPLSIYLNRFPEVKTKVSKRGRKLVDFDSSRHNVDSLKGAKKRDEGKIMKAQEELNDCKRIYEDMNTQLHEELPTLHDERVLFYTSTFENLFQVQEKFHKESARTREALTEAVQALAIENDKGTYKTNKLPYTSRSSGDYNGSTSPSGSTHASPIEDNAGPSLASTFHVALDKDAEPVNGHHESPQGSPQVKVRADDEPEPEPQKLEIVETPMKEATGDDGVELESPPQPSEPTPSSQMNGPSNEEPVVMAVRHNSIPETSGVEEEQDRPYEPIDVGAQIQDDKRSSQNSPVTPDSPNNNMNKDDSRDDDYSLATEIHEDVYKVPESNQPVRAEGGASLPPGVLYQARATHPYAGEDADELSFETGDIVNVVAYDDPEDQDDGWLMGKLNDRKGVFPENFTKRL